MNKLLELQNKMCIIYRNNPKMFAISEVIFKKHALFYLRAHNDKIGMTFTTKDLTNAIKKLINIVKNEKTK